jgi:hypothetical protein
MSTAIPTYRVELDVAGGQAVLDVPSFLGADAASRRAFWTAVAAGWGEPDEVVVRTVSLARGGAGMRTAYAIDEAPEREHDCCDRCGRGSCPGSGSGGEDACKDRPPRRCTEPSCDGETHYTGRRDPVTDEDVEAGPCPVWMARS